MLKLEQSAQQNPNRKLPYRRHCDRDLAEIISIHKDSLCDQPYTTDYSNLQAMELILRRWLWDNQARWGSVRVDGRWLAEQVAKLREVEVVHSLDILLGLCLCAWLEFHQVGESGYDLAGLLRLDNDPPLPHEFTEVPAIAGPLHVVSWDAPPPIPCALRSQIDDVVSVFEKRLEDGELPKTILFELIPMLHRTYRQALHHTMRSREVRLNTKPLSEAVDRIDAGRSGCKERPVFTPRLYDGLWLLAYFAYAFHKGAVVRDMLDAGEISPREAMKLR